MIKDDNHIRRVKVTEDLDGDTIRVDGDLGYYEHVDSHIRLNGLDCPESETYEGIRAAEATRQWVKLAKVLVVETVLIKKTAQDKKEKYGRILGTFWRDDDPVSLNDFLLKNGFAKIYNGGKRV